MAWALTVEEAVHVRTDSDAFETLYRAEYPRIHAIAMRTGLDADESEDVAQEAFAQYHRSHSADAPYADAWLRRAVVHLALNAIRSRRRREAREERDYRTGEPLAPVRATESDPSSRLESAERSAAVRVAMGRLSERHASVLALRYSGMSYAEVGVALGIPVTQVGSVLRRAESAFKKEFEHASR